MSNTQLATVEFHGQPLTVITSQNGEHLVAMKPICENIGIDWEAQRKRIMRHEVLKSVTSMMEATAADGKNYEYTCLPLDHLNGWLFGVDSTRVKPEIRPRLIQYQRECFHVLAAYWQQGEVTNPRKASKPKALPNGLTTEQQEAIKGLVKARLESVPKDKQAKAAITCWSSLKSKFGCTYKEIAPEHFTEAISLLARVELEGEWLPKQAEVQASANTLDELDLAMLYVFCIDTLELVYVGEKLKPVFETLRAPLTMNVRKCLSECREAVAHLHERFGSQMEQAARRRNAFDGRLNLAAAGDSSQPIWVPRRA